MELGRESEWYQYKAHRNTWCFTWLNSAIRWDWPRKEKVIWREKRQEGRRSSQGARKKKKISGKLRWSKKTQGWICKEDTQQYQWYDIFFSCEIWKRTRARNRESNSTDIECLDDPTSPTFYATAARFVNDEDVPEILLTGKTKTEVKQYHRQKTRRLFSDYACLSVVVVLFIKCKEENCQWVSQFFSWCRN